MARKTKDNAEGTAELSITDYMKKFSQNGGFEEFITDRPQFSTGCLTNDIALNGGWARDRVIEIYGPSGSMKTSNAGLGLASYQRTFDEDAPFLFVEVERSTLRRFFQGLGVKTGNIWVEKPRTAEDAMNFISNTIRTGKFRGCILDSIDALESQEEVGKDYGEATMMKLPKLLSEAMRDLSKACVDYDCFIMLINQVRTGMAQYGSFETTSGGKAIPYYASQRVRFASKGPSKENPLAISIETQVKKNKLGPLIKAETLVDFIPGKGWDVVSDHFNLGESLTLLDRKGSYYDIRLDLETETPIARVQGFNGFASWLDTGTNKAAFQEACKVAARSVQVEEFDNDQAQNAY